MDSRNTKTAKVRPEPPEFRAPSDGWGDHIPILNTDGCLVVYIPSELERFNIWPGFSGRIVVQRDSVTSLTIGVGDGEVELLFEILASPSPGTSELKLSYCKDDSSRVRGIEPGFDDLMEVFASGRTGHLSVLEVRPYNQRLLQNVILADPEHILLADKPAVCLKSVSVTKTDAYQFPGPSVRRTVSLDPRSGLFLSNSVFLCQELKVQDLRSVIVGGDFVPSQTNLSVKTLHIASRGVCEVALSQRIEETVVSPGGVVKAAGGASFREVKGLDPIEGSCKIRGRMELWSKDDKPVSLGCVHSLDLELILDSASKNERDNSHSKQMQASVWGSLDDVIVHGKGAAYDPPEERPVIRFEPGSRGTNVRFEPGLASEERSGVRNRPRWLAVDARENSSLIDLSGVVWVDRAVSCFIEGKSDGSFEFFGSAADKNMFKDSTIRNVVVPVDEVRHRATLLDLDNARNVDLHPRTWSHSGSPFNQVRFSGEREFTERRIKHFRSRVWRSVQTVVAPNQQPNRWVATHMSMLDDLSGRRSQFAITRVGARYSSLVHRQLSAPRASERLLLLVGRIFGFGLRIVRPLGIWIFVTALVTSTQLDWELSESWAGFGLWVDTFLTTLIEPASLIRGVSGADESGLETLKKPYLVVLARISLAVPLGIVLLALTKRVRWAGKDS